MSVQWQGGDSLVVVWGEAAQQTSPVDISQNIQIVHYTSYNFLSTDELL